MATNTIKLTITPNSGSATTKELTLARERGTTGACLFRSYEVNQEGGRPDKPLFDQRDWSGGFGQGNFTDETRYSAGSNIDTTQTGQIFLGPLINSTTIHGGGNLGAAPVDFELFGSTLYVATATKIYSWSTGDAHWDLKKTYSTGDNITDLHSFGGYLFVGRGASTAYDYTSDGANYTTSTLTDGYANGFLTAPAGAGTTMILWKWKTPNQIASHSTGLNGTQWTTAAYIGDSGYNITNLLLPHDNLFVGKVDNLYHYDSDGKSYPLMPELRCAQSTNNFKSTTYWQGSAYFSLGSRVGEVTAYSSFDNVGPLDHLEHISQTGSCVALTSDRDWVYAFMQEGSNYICYKGRESLKDNALAWSWCPWANLSTNSVATATVCQFSGENPKLWFGYGSAAAYITLSDNPPADTYTYAASGYLETGWFDAGARDWNKLIDAVLAEAKMSSGAMSATKNVTLSYATDDGTSFTQIDTAITTATMGSKKYTDTAPVAAKKVKFKIALATDSSSVTPIVKYFAAYGFIQPARVRLFDFTVFAEQGTTGMTKDIRDFLIDGRDSTSLITLVDRFGSSHYVRILPGYPQEIEMVNQEGKQVGIAMKVMCEKVDWS